MPPLTVNAIVTRYADYKDNDRMLSLFTREQGMLSCAARGCRRAKSPLLGASELFVSGEFVLYKGGDKYTLDSAEIRDGFYPLREDVDRFAAASYMLSLINAGAEETANGALYSLLRYALAYTAYSECDPLDIAICFAVRSLNCMGYRPAITQCARCGGDVRRLKTLTFSAAHGGALCENCARLAEGDEVSALSLEALRRMLLLKDEEMDRVRLPKRVREELKMAVNAFAEATLEHRFKALEFI